MRSNKRSEIIPDGDKFRELILFVAEKSEGDPRFGATKLNKILFFVDFIAFVTLGQSVTGQRYQKLENGPAPRALVPAIKKMEARNEIAFRERLYYGKVQKRAVALREPDLSLFSGPEVQLVNDIIDEFWGKSASDMSRLSHDFLGWELAEIGEDIPYEVSLVTMDVPGKRARQHGIELEETAKRLSGKGS
jgi:hypothetical protein